MDLRNIYILGLEKLFNEARLGANKHLTQNYSTVIFFLSVISFFLVFSLIFNLITGYSCFKTINSSNYVESWGKSIEGNWTYYCWQTRGHSEGIRQMWETSKIFLYSLINTRSSTLNNDRFCSYFFHVDNFLSFVSLLLSMFNPVKFLSFFRNTYIKGTWSQKSSRTAQWK